MYTKLRDNKKDDFPMEDKIEQLYPGLEQYCYFLSQNKWDGDDIAQESMVKAILKYGHTQHEITPALLKKIAYHCWVDMVRKRKHEKLGSDNEFIEVESSNNAARIENSIDIIQQLRKLLTPKQAVIFLLKEAFQYQAKEIAEVLNTTEIAVKSVISRTKKRLEKSNQTEASFSVEPFWCEEEQELLSDLFYQALHAQDPNELIKAIPSFHSLESEAVIPKLVVSTKQPHSTHSPSSHFCMAA
ncbi:RNA polymerase subunit sigma [Bacillus sp. FJAT-49732]|uniref:RNA polymerase subunit sigma n=1 Tax=Lederbergia citrisecunda TaxID=2833583 RepID=A0A942TRF0_9BACI|nr:sigma factor-like helix-turn-helix DNA-binding protein [Lederbergia citrisecunda]MBS4202168.1 RNA polymerase subunit sigma [Lederbergia citrisecunda]